MPETLRKFGLQPDEAVVAPKRSAATVVRGLVLALVLPLAALGGMLLLDSTLQGRYPLLLFSPAVMLSALYAGAVTGMLSTIFSLFLVDMYLLEPRGTLQIDSFDDVFALLVFLLIGASFSLLSQRLRNSSHRLAVREHSVQQLHRHLDNVLRGTSDAFVTFDPQWRYTYVNPQAEAYLGRGAEELLGRRIWDVFPQLCGTEGEARLRQAADTGQPQHYETLSPITNKWIQVHAFPIESGLSIFFRDVTEQRVAERAVRERGEEFQRLIEMLPVGVFMAHDAECRRITGNPAAYRLLRCAPESNMSMSAVAAERPTNFRTWRGDQEISPEDLPIQRAVRRGKPVTDVDLRCEFEDGSVLYEAVYATPLFDETGKVRGGVAAIVDISELKRAETALRESEARYRRLLKVMPAAVYTCEAPSGVITFFNEQAAELWGRTPKLRDTDERFCGSFKLFLENGEPLPHDRTPMAVALSEGKSFRNQRVGMERPDGSKIIVRVNIDPILDERGSIIGAINVFHEVTELVRAEEELRRHRDRLEELVVERTGELDAAHEKLRMTERMAMIGTLASGLGHDLANLLMPIRLCVDAMASKGLPEAAEKYLAPIRKSAEYLQNLSNGLRQLSLDPSRPGKMGTSTVLTEWWADVEPLIRAVLPRHVSLDAEIAAELPPVGLAKHQMTQIVFNLVQNAGDAMRDCESGTVSIRCAAGTRNSLVLRVADTGPGMSADVRRRCLEPFFTTKTRGLGGTGMGLALVHSIVSGAGGQVEIESQEGAGTTFVLRLPLARYESEPTGADNGRDRPTAVVSLRSPQKAAYTQCLLRSFGYDLVVPDNNGNSAVSVWIMEDAAEALALVTRGGVPPRADRVIVFDEMPAGHSTAVEGRLLALGREPKAAAIREALRHPVVGLSGLQTPVVLAAR